MSCAPIVLEVRGIRDVIPLPANLSRVFGVLLRITEQEIREVIPAETSVEIEVSFGIGKGILALFIERPTGPELQLVRSLGQGNIIANLVVVRLVNPRRPVGSVVGSSHAIQIDRRDAGIDVRSGKQPVEGEARGSGYQSRRNDSDAVAVVIERSLVEQRRADDIGSMDHRAVRRVAKSIGDRRHIIAAPLGGPVGLGCLFGNPMPKD